MSGWMKEEAAWAERGGRVIMDGGVWSGIHTQRTTYRILRMSSSPGGMEYDYLYAC